jgi:hypothetical protein
MSVAAVVDTVIDHRSGASWSDMADMIWSTLTAAQNGRGAKPLRDFEL